MRLSAAVGLTTMYVLLSPYYINAQTHAPTSIKHFPSVPMTAPTLNDNAASLRVSEMMPFVAPLLFEAPGIKQTLVLVNASTESSSATVTLFSTDGKRSSQRAISLAPHEKREYPVSSLQEDTMADTHWGSLLLEQTSTSGGAAIVGQVIITDERASIPAYVDEELAMPEMEGSPTLTAVTDQSEGPPVLAITNISPVAQNVLMQCLKPGHDRSSLQMHLAGHETTTIKACSRLHVSTLIEYTSSISEDNARGVYGISLEGSGDPGSITAFGLSPHHRGRDIVFSAIPFYDPGTIHSSDIVFAGVPIGGQDTLPSGIYLPHLALANFSTQPLAFSVFLADTDTYSAEEAEALRHSPPLNLIHKGIIPPLDAGEYTFSGTEAQSGLLHSIVVTTDASPGTYQAKLVSRSTGTLYEAELLAKESMDMNNGGVHPWTLSNDTQSHILLFNHSDSNKKVAVFINAGAVPWSKDLILAAEETREISIKDIQTNRTPDDHGRLIPLTATSGVVDWMTPQSGNVTGRLMVTSRDSAMARSFSCGTYSGICNLDFLTLDDTIGIAQTLQLYEASASVCLYPTQSTHNKCTYGSTTQGTVDYGWTVGATSIITLNTSSEGSKPSPLLRGVSAGNGTALVQAQAGQCSSTATGTPTVPPCPTSVTLSTTTTEPLSSIPADKTGIGIVATMTVGPATPIHNGATISESVSQVSSDCGTSAPNFCQASTTPFTVGAEGTALNGQNFASATNVFYDEHKATSTVSVLSPGDSCTAVCKQTYSCGGQPIGTNSFTITYNLVAGTLNGKPVTNVNVTKQ